jgi:hypothetical protein
MLGEIEDEEQRFFGPGTVSVEIVWIYLENVKYLGSRKKEYDGFLFPIHFLEKGAHESVEKHAELGNKKSWENGR